MRVLIRISSAFAAFAIGVAAIITAVHAADPVTEQRLANMNGRLTRLEGILNNKTLLDMLQRIEELQRELQATRDASDQIAHELQGLKARQRELYLDVDQRLRVLETAKPAAATGGPPPTTAATTAPREQTKPRTARASVEKLPARARPNVVASDADRRAYEKAFNLLNSAHYEESISALRQFLNDYPQSIYASNAQYWLAEASYVTGKYARAAEEFKQVIDQYPDSIKVPDAKLKLGFALYGLEQWDKARAVLNDLTRQYPNTTVAQLAENRLERMESEGH